MPIPKPLETEDFDLFIDRCVIFLIDDGIDYEKSKFLCEREYNLNRARLGKSFNEDILDQEVSLTREFNNDDLLQGVFMGSVSPLSLPDSLYLFSVLSFMSVMSLGFGLPDDFKSDRLFWLTNYQKKLRYLKAIEFSNNISIFSGAKTFNEVFELSQAVFDEYGLKRSFEEFEAIGKKINEKYNSNWLRVEQDAVFRRSEAAEQWILIEEQSKEYPYLEYRTQRDERVRASHAALDGTTAKVSDPIWDKLTPPLAWNCRCYLKQLTISKKNIPNEAEEYDDKIFGTNPGKTNKLITDSHPYFTNIPKEFKRSLKNNFGFELPSDDEIRQFIKNGN